MVSFLTLVIIYTWAVIARVRPLPLCRYIPWYTYLFSISLSGLWRIIWAVYWQTLCKTQGRPLIDLISPPKSLTKAVLYYIRLDTHNSRALFEDKATATPSFSQIVVDELLAAATRKDIKINQWAIAPDAIHALVSLSEHQPEPDCRLSKPRKLTSFVASVKAATAKRINLVRNQPGCPVWKRSYQDHRVEDERTFSRLAKQIEIIKNATASKV